MRVVMAAAWTLALVALLAAGASADDDAELKAVEALLRPGPQGERAEPTDDALAALLAAPGHDVWRLVEHLLAQDRQDVAIRFAALAPEAKVGPVLVYAQDAEAVAGAAERARHLEAAMRANRAKEWAAALEHLDRLRAVPGRATVFDVYGDALGGTVLWELKRRPEAIETGLRAGEEALRLGWWDAAATVFPDVLEQAMAASSFDFAARAAEGTRTVLEVRGDGGPLADAVQNLGALCQQRGDRPGALRHYDEALSRYEQLGQAADVAEVRSLRSLVLADLGDFRAALDDQRMLATYFADRPRDAAWADNQLHLGLVRYRLADETGSAEALRQALGAFQSLGDAEGAAGAQGNLGLTHAMGGRWSEAIEAYRAAFTVLDGLGDAVGAAQAKHNMADALQAGAAADLRAADLASVPAEGEEARRRARAALAQARALVEEAIPVLRDSWAAGLTCAAVHTLGQILLTEGSPQQALDVLQPARDEALRLRSWQTTVLATTSIAQARLQLGDAAGALREARVAAEELGRALTGLAETDMARARALRPDVFDIGVSAAVQTNSKDDLLYFLEAGRASALLRGLGGRAAALRATVPRSLADKLTASTRAKVAAFAAWQDARKARTAEARSLWTAYEAAREEEQRTLEETQRVQAEAASRLAPSRLVSISDIQTRLKSTAKPGLRQVFALFNFQGSEASALLVGETATRIVRYPVADLGALREALAAVSGSRRGELDPEVLAAVKRLWLDPLQLPAGPTRLFVSPDRDLAYAPLSAIVPDDWELAFEASATTYDLLAERRLRKGQRILGLGDPDYGAAPDPDALATRGGPRLTRLKESRAEVEAIAARPEDRRLLWTEATEAGLAKELAAAGPERPWRSVHLACHGLVDVEVPALSCLAITPGDGEDGFLTSSEVLRLAMTTDLAVLSACQTGRGKFVRGEGVMSLTRAFMFAGAKRTLVSLWDVDDAATSFLMQAFYKEWTAGRGTAEALRSAQRAVRDHVLEETIEEPGKPPRKESRRPWTDPKFWAAWALWGLAD